MNSAQRAAFVEMVRIADQMSNVCSALSGLRREQIEQWELHRVNMRELVQQWDAAHTRYCELEHEAKQSRTAQQMARKGLGRKSTAGR